MACFEGSEDTDSRSGEETCTRFLFEGSEPGLNAAFLAEERGLTEVVLALDEEVEVEMPVEIKTPFAGLQSKREKVHLIVYSDVFSFW